MSASSGETEQAASLSIALVTMNRPHYLRRWLESIANQSVAPHEVVVSDDSDGCFSSEIQELVSKSRFRYITGPRRGLYANRNNAALACSGSHILTADDDHVHPVDYVEQVQRTIAQDPRAVWTFTEARPGPPGLPRPAQMNPDGTISRPASDGVCTAIADGSSVYPREVFDAGLRYDETYPFGRLWYLWGQELVGAGWRVKFSDTTHVIHDVDSIEDRADNVAFLAHQIEADLYVLGRTALHGRHPMCFVRFAFQSIARMTVASRYPGYNCSARVTPAGVWRVLGRLRHAPRRPEGVEGRLHK